MRKPIPGIVVMGDCISSIMVWMADSMLLDLGIQFLGSGGSYAAPRDLAGRQSQQNIWRHPEVPWPYLVRSGLGCTV